MQNYPSPLAGYENASPLPDAINADGKSLTPTTTTTIMPKVLNSALDAVGNTPLIRLSRLSEHYGLKCNLLGKVEYMSAGGSVKDRIAKAMVEAAEKEGKLIPGKSVVIEPTSGNTGIGLAMACAIKEKEAALRALGAEVVRTPTEAAWDSPESHIGVAQKLQREIPFGIILDQYRNLNNPLAHELTTGPEIIEAVVSTPATAERPSSGKVDVVVASAGTGGTVTGISRAVKRQHNKDCVIVGVDPEGSILAFPDSLNTEHEGDAYVVEGIGYDFIPDVLSRDPADVDRWIKTNDTEAFAGVQLLMKKEGLLVGGSSGSALSGAVKWLKESKEGREIAETPGINVVLVLPDGIRNYIGKEWFLKNARQPSPLADVIANIAELERKDHPKNAAATKRLGEVANTIRWLTERSLHVLNSQTMEKLRSKLLTGMTHEGVWVQPVVLDYVKTLKCLVASEHHLLALESEAWQKLVKYCFNVILDDPLSTELDIPTEKPSDPAGSTSRPHPYSSPSSADNSLSDDDESEDDVLPNNKRKRGGTPGTSKRLHLSNSVDTNQVAFMDLLCTLMNSKSSPILEDNIALGILRRLRRFLKLYPTDTSLHHDFLHVLLTTLNHISLNKKDGMIEFANASWQSLLGLWGTKNKRLKEGLVCILRILFPYLVSGDGRPSQSIAIEGVRKLWRLLAGEVESKWGIDALSMDSLRLELREFVKDVIDGESAFVAKTFRAGSRFDSAQALTWAVLELQADCAEKLYQHSESVYSIATPSRNGAKGSRIENPLSSILLSLSSRTSSLMRTHHVQLLLFFIDRHWGVLHEAIKAKIMTALVDLVSFDDGHGTVQSWIFLCFAAIAYAEYHSESKKDDSDLSVPSPTTSNESAVWEQVWTHAIRRTNVPAVCRAASHTAQTLLVCISSQSTHHSLALTFLPNQRVLSEIENLAKDLDVQGPAYPHDSVCYFLSTCLRIASQDVRLFRMQFEDKVLTWLIDCWRPERINDSETPLYSIKDIALLLETISSCSRRSSLMCRTLLPDCPVVQTLVQEEKTRVIREFSLYARLPPFDKNSGSAKQANQQASSIPSDADLVPPRGKERKVSSFLLKPLETLNDFWQNSQNVHAHTRASAVRRTLDMALTALSFESILVLNGVRSNRSVIQSACKLIRHVVPLLSDRRWTTEEKALVLLGLEPLIMTGLQTYDDCPWIAMVPPGPGTGIKSRVLKSLTLDDSSLHLLQQSRMDHLKVIWQTADAQDVSVEICNTMRALLRIITGQGPTAGAGDVMDVDDADGFAPIKTAAADKTNALDDQHSLCTIASVSIQFLTVSPILQSTSGEATRDKELTEFLLGCAQDEPDIFLLIAPIFVDHIRNETFSLSPNNVEAFLNELGVLLGDKFYSRSENLHSLTIQFLDSTLHLWVSGALEEDVAEQFTQLCRWFSKKLHSGNLPNWIVRDKLARLFGKYVARDPHGSQWPAVKDGKERLRPVQLLAGLSSDVDIRVRFRAASLVADMFEATKKVYKSPMELYHAVRTSYTTRLEQFEQMLTRMLSLGNIMIVSSAVRRGPYWHLLETCYHTEDYNRHIHAVLDAVVQRIGVKDLSTLFEAYATQLAYTISIGGQDILRVPIHILGYRDAKERASATFRAMSPISILFNTQGDEHGLQLFEGHCNVLQKQKSEGLSECFGDIIGYQLILALEDDCFPVEKLGDLVARRMEVEDFSVIAGMLRERLDSVIVTVLRTLGDQDFTPNGTIVKALQEFDESGESSVVFSATNRYRTLEDFELHEPNLPNSGIRTVLRALSWLSEQAPIDRDTSLTYHVLQALLANVQATFLLNEQLRLVNAITLWVAYRSADFSDATLLHVLIRGGCALLEQSDLIRPAQSLLDWCFGRYSKLGIKDPRFPDILIRVSGQCYDYSQAIDDTLLAEMGTSLLAWIDNQVFRLSEQKSLHSQLRFALSAWPHQPSQLLSPLYSDITPDSLSKVLNDSHIKSNKFRLVRQLRSQTSRKIYDKSQFAETHFWRLKECIPSRGQLRPEDVHAFADLLVFHKGSVSSFGNEQLMPSSQHSRNRRKDREKELTLSPADFILQTLLYMLESENAISRHSAYNTLRSIMSVSNSTLRPVQSAPDEYRDEVQYLERYHVTHVAQSSQSSSDLSVVLNSEVYTGTSADFPVWIGAISTLLADILSASNPLFAQLSDILHSQATFAELILPRLVQTVLQSPPDGEDIAQSRYTTLSTYFSSILSSEHASVPCRRSIIDVVLHLRHINRSSTDPLAHDKWLNLDYLLLARNAIACGAYTTALLFLELASEYQSDSVRSIETTEKVMYEIYSNIDEPDGFYGIQPQDHYQFLMKRFHHERQWEKAFRFHGAALEADMGNAAETEGLLNAFQSYGFNHLATQTLLNSISTQDPESVMTYQLGWRTETWDLPDIRGEASSGASLYLALRALHRERDQRVADTVIQHVLFQEMDCLRSLGSENVSQIRQAVQRLMSLSQICQWRNPAIQSRISARQSDIGVWSDFIGIDTGFEFPDIESIMATRISLVRSIRQKEQRQQIGTMVSPFSQLLLDVEKGCLLSLSKAARGAQQIQIALNSVLRAKKLETSPSFQSSEEFASVLWLDQEPKHAVESLKDLLRPLQHTSLEPQMRIDVALATAQLGSWTAQACLEKPSHISREFFQPAIALLEGSSSNTESHAHAQIHHEYAMFAERQYYAILKSPDALRWKFYRERKEQELRERDAQLAELKRRGRDGTSEFNKVYNARNKAAKILKHDTDEDEQFTRERDEFLKQAIEMYSLCLEATDIFDEDAPIRFCSLWLANFHNDHIESKLEDALGRIASRKFLFLAHQLTARLSSAEKDTKAQKLLHNVILRMSQEHPFHTLYQVFCLKPLIPVDETAKSRRTSGRHSSPATLSASQNERSTAATDIFSKLRNDPASQDRTLAIEEICLAALDLANQPAKKLKQRPSSGQTVKVNADNKILHLSRCRGRVPVMTVSTPVDPSMKYSNCVWIDKYPNTFEVAGGVNLPKITWCTAMDGTKHKQLFKGEESDDLRQDAVMEQVFELVNMVLRRDSETRRRNLSIRTYRVVPLDTQAGVLEFVVNTQPLRQWLSPAHQKYLPPGKMAGQMQKIVKDYGDAYHKNANNPPRTSEAKLAHYLKYAEQFPPVMRHYFREKHKTPISWFSMRLNYTRSVATTSIVGHILGLGDRHTSNILLDTHSGQLVHIDLGIAFDQGKLLPIPETVPFRMTRDMVDGMGISGTDGVFQRCAEETLRVLRDGSEVMMTVLEVFRHDPLHNWTVSEIKAKKAQTVPEENTESEEGEPGKKKGKEKNKDKEKESSKDTIIQEQMEKLGVTALTMGSGTAEEAADRALTGVIRKLDKSMSVAAVVRGLVADARDPANLSAIYHAPGWSPLY
ncbi:hypothetical protein D9758_007817 [Tetrapyrgos nigripes]|uniref:Serine/threonine-protein kinase TEL1 n=1 Tax=Tetrapyrgos nigripes TaxID=182062 RepID=A0A8H5CYH6_9AGAR|nr:hypothetical protein D9758_007817 [Tetrapyrgos nigripes]